MFTGTATSIDLNFCKKWSKWVKSFISTLNTIWWPEKAPFSFHLKKVSTEATIVKIGDLNRKFRFLTKFNIILVYPFQHKPTSLTKGPSVTFDESVIPKWLKTIDISRYFI